MTTFTLDQLRAEVERKYAPIKVALPDGSECTLRHMMRLDNKVRDEVMAIIKRMDAGKDDDDYDFNTSIGNATEILKLVGDKGTRLVKELDGDVALTQLLFERWVEGTQPGEATPSDS